jgi:HTH-type transcriptional regulator, quorum sensing regulator NprR
MPTLTRRRPVHQKAKGPVDPEPGLRVRQFREARGFSQAQLAAADFTKGYVSLVETGRSRMSLRAAQIFAARLGVTVASLLQAAPSEPSGVELDLLRAESEFHAGRVNEAVEATRKLERRAAGPLRARLLRLRGRALTQSDRSVEAITSLDEALRLFRTASDREMVARTLYDLALAHARMEELGEALNMAMQCEQALNNAHVVDRVLELQVLSFLAGALVTLGDVGAADIRTERAKAVAQDVADPRAVANLYQSLAITQQGKGDLEAAMAYARKSLTAYEQLGNRAAVGSSWNTIGWVYIKRGQLQRAAEALDRAEEVGRASDDGRLLAYVLQTRAELALVKGDVKNALRLADESITHPAASSRCRALSLLVRAQALAKAKGSGRDVKAAFAKSFNALAPHGRRQLASAYEAYFEALTARGLLQEAGVAARKAMELMQPAAT